MLKSIYLNVSCGASLLFPLRLAERLDQQYRDGDLVQHMVGDIAEQHVANLTDAVTADDQQVKRLFVSDRADQLAWVAGLKPADGADAGHHQLLLGFGEQGVAGLLGTLLDHLELEIGDHAVGEFVGVDDVQQGQVDREAFAVGDDRINHCLREIGTVDRDQNFSGHNKLLGSYAGLAVHQARQQQNQVGEVGE